MNDSSVLFATGVLVGCLLTLVVTHSAEETNKLVKQALNAVPYEALFVHVDESENIAEGVYAFQVLLCNAGAPARVRNMRVTFADRNLQKVTVDITSKKFLSDAYLKYCELHNLPMHVDGYPCSENWVHAALQGVHSISIVPANLAHRDNLKYTTLLRVGTLEAFKQLRMDTLKTFLEKSTLEIDVEPNPCGVQRWVLPLDGSHPGSVFSSQF